MFSPSPCATVHTYTHTHTHTLPCILDTLHTYSKACIHPHTNRHAHTHFQIGREWLEGVSQHRYTTSPPAPFYPSQSLINSMGFLWLLNITGHTHTHNCTDMECPTNTGINKSIYINITSRIWPWNCTNNDQNPHISSSQIYQRYSQWSGAALEASVVSSCKLTKI